MKKNKEEFLNCTETQSQEIVSNLNRYGVPLPNMPQNEIYKNVPLDQILTWAYRVCYLNY